MNTISLDIGTTAAKAAAFEGSRRVGEVLRASMPVRVHGDAAELDAGAVLQLVLGLIGRLAGQLRGRVDCIAVAAMSPAVCLLDREDRPVTPIICHLDRRSQAEAIEIAGHFGQQELLRTMGNLPIPGGIACTILRWLQTHQPDAWRRAARIVPLTTLITCRLTGHCACDPGTAAFLGTYSIAPHYTAGGIRPWQGMLDFLQIPADALPQVMDGGAVIGRVAADVAAELHMETRPVVLAGLMDTSAACAHAGLAVGHMYNVIGTTDVLAICTDRPRPARGVLTRPVGVGPLWLAVGTMAAAGAALDWAHRTFFADYSSQQYYDLLRQVRMSIPGTQRAPGPATRKSAGGGGLTFEPDLAGSRMRIVQRYGTIRGIRFSSSREDILAALIESLASRSRQRLRILSRQARPDGTVFVGGGAAAAGIQDLWIGRFRATDMPEDASLQGLARLAVAAGPGS